MNIRLYGAVLISKITLRACRLARLGGTNLPGKVARAIYPGIMKDIASGYKIIMVTGTNGKTTTTHIIAQILDKNGIRHITNKSGANLLDGVLTTFISFSGLNGKSTVNVALLETDEAAFGKITEYIHPFCVVVTNFFRDQLDRYGELYTTLKSVREGILKSGGTRLILNADDSLSVSLARDTGNEALFYGFGSEVSGGMDIPSKSDAMFCIYCKTRYTYKNHIYGHLGVFSCPNCGYTRPEPHVSCTKIHGLSGRNSSVDLTCVPPGMPYGEQTCFTAKINLPGLYNIYNSLAALSCSNILNLPAENALHALSELECSFGRMETIMASDKYIKLVLVKNPTGFNQVLELLTKDSSFSQLALVINDRPADGIDVSWLWDVDFEKLNLAGERVEAFYTSGTRAGDMAVRLKYAGINTDKISIIRDYGSLIDRALRKTPPEHNFYILPTYTALLDIRKILKGKYELKEFWK